MSQQSKPVLIGAVVAVLIIVAFAAGGMFAERQEGPIEKIAEDIDSTIKN